MRLVIRKDYESVSKWAAEYVAKQIRLAGRPFVLGLPTGSSPEGMYRELAAIHKTGRVSLRDVVTFNMDEYVGLPADHPQSYHTFMWTKLFSHVDVQKKNVHILDGMAVDLDAECRSYEAAITAAGGIDLFVGGVGADGHIAFNEPGSSLASRTRLKTLTLETRQANARFFGGDIEQVPATALTIGVGTFMAAREVLVLVSGRAKARALHHAIEEGINHLWTISSLQLHAKAIVVCDEDATMELKVGTVRYFQEIESVAPTNPDYR
jgi:glucosamine-6-phosphate deaminase